MIPAVLFPDTILEVTGRVRTALAGRPEQVASDVFVGSTVTPQKRHDRMVIVRRDGGARLDGARELVRLGVNVWATSESDVHDLAQLVRSILWTLPDGEPIVAVADSAGPYPVPDESKQPREYLSVVVTVRGSTFHQPTSSSSSS